MIWWGPEGIGATYTIERYALQHSGPFRASFKDRKFIGHICRIAEGNYGGFFGWPNLTLIPTWRIYEFASSQIPGEMRVIDIYIDERIVSYQKIGFSLIFSIFGKCKELIY